MFSVSGDSKNFTFGLPSFLGPKANIVTLSDVLIDDSLIETDELSERRQEIFGGPGKYRKNNNKTSIINMAELFGFLEQC